MLTGIIEPALNIELMNMVIDSNDVGIWDWDLVSGDIKINSSLANQIGYSLSELQPINFETWVLKVHPVDLERANEKLNNYHEGKAKSYSSVVRMFHKDGHFVWIKAKGKTVQWDEDGVPTRMIGIHIDVTPLKQANHDLETKTNLLKEAQKIARLGGWEFNIETNKLIFTEEACGIKNAEVNHDTPFENGLELFTPESKKVILTALEDAIVEGDDFDIELEAITKNGKKIDVRTTCSVTKVNGVPIKLTGIFQDITQHKSVLKNLEQSHKKLLTQTLYDPLTGLPNRKLLAERMEEAILRSNKINNQFAIAFIDIDGFKLINDKYNHSVGDELLCHIAKRLKRTVRSCDTVARFGGDEFIAIIDDIGGESSYTPMIERMLHALAMPITFNGYTFNVTGSIGVTSYPTDTSEPGRLIRHADQAMFTAKTKGKNTYHLFDVNKGEEAINRNAELTSIKNGLKNKEFVLYYQPKINLGDMNVLGVEGLIRWNHPTRGVLEPAEFLPLIEQDMLIVDFGNYVISQALEQLKIWKSKGCDFAISVNISPLQIQHATFFPYLQRMLEKHKDYTPGSLTLEILENASFSNFQHTSKVIEACIKMGVNFAIDDFGTGYSSLSYLKKLNARYLKIDKGFIIGMLNDSEDCALVEGIIGLARAFDCQIIAEGVETIEHGRKLRELGCDYAQGYGIAKPMPIEKLQEWLDGWLVNAEWNALSVMNNSH